MFRHRIVLYCINRIHYIDTIIRIPCAVSLKPDSSADHSAYTWTAARPAAANLALDIDAAVFIAESHATCAVIALVIGVE